jgi:uncharacterized membrane protein
MLPDQTRKTKLRAMQYHFIDGSFEFTFGGLCLLMAGYFTIQTNMPESLLSTILSMSFVVITSGGVFLIDRLVRRFKEQVTYPRTGYIAYQRPQGVRSGMRAGFMLGLAAIIGGSMAAFITRSPRSMDWMTGMTALVFAAALAWVGFRFALRRFYINAFLVFLSGFILTFIGMGNMPGLTLFYALAGGILLLSGGWTLLRYLHNHPASNQVSDEL